MEPRHGTFVNILGDDRSEWARQVDSYRRLAGLHHVELLCERELTDGDVTFLTQVLEGLDVTMHAPYLGVSLCAADNEIRSASINRVARAATRAHQLGCPVVTVHSGVVGAWESPEQTDPRLIDSLHRIAESAPVRIALENMPARGGGSREPVAELHDLQRLIQAMPDLAITLDIGHVLQVGGRPEQWLDALTGHVVNMHLHDGIAQGRGHLPLDSGELKLDQFVGHLITSGFAGHLALETLGFEDTALSWKKLRRSYRAHSSATG